MKCPICKKKINNTAAFCRYCGSPTSTPAAAPSMCNICGRALNPGEVCTCTSYTPVTPQPPVFAPAPESGSDSVEWSAPPFGAADGFDEEATVSLAGLSDAPSTAFCLLCGRVLHSGEKCTCSDSSEEALGTSDTKEANPDEVFTVFGGTEADVEDGTAGFAPEVPDFAPSPEELKISMKSAPKASPEEERKKAEGKAFFRPAGDL